VLIGNSILAYYAVTVVFGIQTAFPEEVAVGVLMAGSSALVNYGVVTTITIADEDLIGNARGEDRLLGHVMAEHCDIIVHVVRSATETILDSVTKLVAIGGIGERLILFMAKSREAGIAGILDGNKLAAFDGEHHRFASDITGVDTIGNISLNFNGNRPCAIGKCKVHVGGEIKIINCRRSRGSQRKNISVGNPISGFNIDGAATLTSTLDVSLPTGLGAGGILSSNFNEVVTQHGQDNLLAFILAPIVLANVEAISGAGSIRNIGGCGHLVTLAGAFHGQKDSAVTMRAFTQSPQTLSGAVAFLVELLVAVFKIVLVSGIYFVVIDVGGVVQYGGLVHFCSAATLAKLIGITVRTGTICLTMRILCKNRGLGAIRQEAGMSKSSSSVGIAGASADRAVTLSRCSAGRIGILNPIVTVDGIYRDRSVCTGSSAFALARGTSPNLVAGSYTSSFLGDNPTKSVSIGIKIENLEGVRQNLQILGNLFIVNSQRDLLKSAEGVGAVGVGVTLLGAGAINLNGNLIVALAGACYNVAAANDTANLTVLNSRLAFGLAVAGLSCFDYFPSMLLGINGSLVLFDPLFADGALTQGVTAGLTSVVDKGVVCIIVILFVAFVNIGVRQNVDNQSSSSGSDVVIVNQYKEHLTALNGASEVSLHAGSFAAGGSTGLSNVIMLVCMDNVERALCAANAALVVELAVLVKGGRLVDYDLGIGNVFTFPSVILSVYEEIATLAFANKTLVAVDQVAVVVAQHCNGFLCLVRCGINNVVFSIGVLYSATDRAFVLCPRPIRGAGGGNKVRQRLPRTIIFRSGCNNVRSKIRVAVQALI